MFDHIEQYRTDCTFLPLRVVRPSTYIHILFIRSSIELLFQVLQVYPRRTHVNFYFYHHDRDYIFVEGMDSFEYLLYIFHHADQVELKAIYHI